jgi:hypothetical protein
LILNKINEKVISGGFEQAIFGAYQKIKELKNLPVDGAK